MPLATVTAMRLWRIREGGTRLRVEPALAIPWTIAMVTVVHVELAIDAV